MNVLSSLTNRIFLASALLVVASMGIAIYRVNVSVATQAEADLRLGLAEAASLVDQVSSTKFADFMVKGRLIADLPRLQAAAANDDPPTVQPVADEYQHTIGADLFAVIGRGGRVLARAGRIVLDDEALSGIQTASRSTGDGTYFWPFPGGLLHVAVIPFEDGVHRLIIGTSLDRDAAMQIRSMTNSEIAFVSGGHIVASSLSEARAKDLADVEPATQVFTRVLGDEEYIGRVQPLGHAENAGAPVALVLRSRTEHLKFLPPLHWQIALTGLGAVLVATLVGYLVARTVTRPLRALTGAMGQMAATGNLASTAPALGRWDDEDVRLMATTFHRLTSALDRFQREAAMRERLSSLGRLSTVVAHEIRNPLMIIKTAVRTLRRHASPDVVDIAASIDEEVLRLNRVVTGVLDFARPVRFVFAETDLAAICRDAAQAALTVADDVPIEVEAAATPLTTDAERVRSVLVNVLTNAQQAVRAKAAGGAAAPPPIVVRATSEAGHRQRVTVEDRGTGIAVGDLARIFDPFFTTRSSGSGLGLAIAKNLIEGLGGTLRVESRLGEGTIVSIELPERGLPAENTA